MGTPYNPERDPDGLYARPAFEDQRRVKTIIARHACRAEAVSGGGAKTRPADDFAWQDFLKTIKSAVDHAAAHNPVLSKP